MTLFAHWSDRPLRTKGLLVVASPAAAAMLIAGASLVMGSGALAATGAFLGVVGGVVASSVFIGGISRRIDQLQKNVARLAAGGVLHPQPKSHDEIDVLSQTVGSAVEGLERQRVALEQAMLGIAEVDSAGRYVSFNRAFSQLTGLVEVSSAPGVSGTVHPDDQQQVKDAIARMRENGRAEFDARVVHPEGRVAHVGMTFVSASEQREAGYFAFLIDLGRRKDTETALIQAKDAAVASNLAKSEFLARISHDIRTPLNAILGATDLLSQSPLDSDQAEYVGMFQRNCRHLVALINDFLDFSKIEAGAVRVENVPYRARQTVEDAVATFRESAERKGLKLATEIDSNLPEWALGDPLRVHQVLVNLLSNALKFTKTGRVDVRALRIAQTEGEWMRFEVSDTGPGIREEDQQRIFAVFAQSGRDDVSASNGCGLGLAICQDLVERMGGTIGVDSQEGSGSTFHFTLPLIGAQPVDAGAQTSGVAPARLDRKNGLRILVAEDAQDNRVLLARYLRGERIEIQFAEDGQQAVDAIRRGGEFDLVLMDLDMPVLDGLEAARAIRAWQSGQSVALTPIVGLSAHAMREAVLKCLDAGCVAHVAKPVDRATLLDAIRRYARRTSQNGGSEGVSKEVAALVPKYLASKFAQIENARVSLAAGDFDPVRRFAHNLKGTGRGYGFPQIEEIGAGMEKAAIDQDEQNISNQLEALGRFLTEENVAAMPAEGLPIQS